MGGTDSRLAQCLYRRILHIFQAREILGVTHYAILFLSFLREFITYISYFLVLWLALSLYSSSFSLIGAKRSLQSHKHQSKESEGIMAAASLSRIHLFMQQPSSNQWKREEKNESVLVSTVNSCSTSKSLSRSRFLYNRAYEI